MNKQTHRITIEIAENGFLIYLNDEFSVTTCRKVPYVFETMESMQAFIRNELTKVY